MTKLRNLLVAVLGGSAMLVVPTGTASAQAAASEQVNEVLRLNPGARQVDANSVELEPGVIMRWADPTHSEDATPRADCRSGDVCIYTEPSFGGAHLDFTKYGDYNLANYKLSNGDKWAHRTSSYRNYQTGHAKANFSRYQASDNTWYGVDECRAVYERSTLGAADNIIDKVRLEP